MQLSKNTEYISKVAVCLAAYNGAAYLQQQLDSILTQVNVEVTIFVSVDKSNDGTEEMVSEFAKADNRVVVLKHGEVLGSAAQNFFRILREVDFSNYDYIGFADQDDIWKPEKLFRHIQLSSQCGADGISSSVIAFWSNGNEKLIDKAQPQRELDFLFESAGPGCTFLMTPWLVSKVREQLIDGNSPAKEIALHDWLAYSICRTHGRKWIIDSWPSVLYRQHTNNVVGANVGLKAKYARFQKLRQGWYRKEVIKIVQVCNRIAPKSETSNLLDLLTSKSYFLHLRLLPYVAKARRNLVDRFFLVISIVTGLF